MEHPSSDHVHSTDKSHWKFEFYLHSEKSKLFQGGITPRRDWYDVTPYTAHLDQSHPVCPAWMLECYNAWMRVCNVPPLPACIVCVLVNRPFSWTLIIQHEKEWLDWMEEILSTWKHSKWLLLFAGEQVLLDFNYSLLFMMHFNIFVEVLKQYL